MVGWVHDFARLGQVCIEVVRVDDVEPSDVLFRLGERPVSHDHATITHADNGRRVGAMECATEDERATRVHLGFEGNDPTHEYSSHWGGRFPRSPYLRMGSAHKDTLIKNNPKRCVAWGVGRASI